MFLDTTKEELIKAFNPQERYARASWRLPLQNCYGKREVCTYVNLKQRADWMVPGCPGSPDLSRISKRKRLCFLFCRAGRVRTASAQSDITSELYIKPFHQLNQAIQAKGPNRQGQIILLHDNAQADAAEHKKTALQESG